MAQSEKFAALMGPVAKTLLGEPNKKLSSNEVLRFGSRGSLELDLHKGTWVDFSTGDGDSREGGGTLDLVARELRTDQKGALKWLEEQRLIDPPITPNGHTKKKEPRKAAPVVREETPQGSGERKLVATYPYVNEDGELLFEVLRFEPKDFRQRRPHPDGGWIWGVSEGTYRRNDRTGDWYPSKDGGEHFPAVRLVPYRFPELRQAIAEGHPIFIPEGEKDVDNLRDLDFAATCNPMGAGKWPDEFGEYLRGADVVLLRDNDEPGHKHVLKVALSCKDKVKRLKTVDLPELPPKGDVSDWLDAKLNGGTPLEDAGDELARLAADAPAWTMPRPITKLPSLTFDDLDKPGAEHEWLIKNFFPRSEPVLVYGPPEAAKSFLVLSAAMSVALGTRFFDRRTERGLVIWQAGEGERGIKKRMRAFRQHHNIPRDARIPFVVMPQKIDLFSDDDDAKALIDFARQWEAFFEMKAELVVVDTVQKSAPGWNENSSEDVSLWLQRQAMISKELSACVVGIHHTNADGGKPRGHTSLSGDIEALIHVEKDLNGKKDERGEAIRYAKVIKQKEGPGGQAFEFSLFEEHLGEDRYGEPITSCVVTKPRYGQRGVGEPPIFEIRGARERLLFETLITLLKGSTTRVATGALGVDQKELKDAFAKVVTGDTEELRRDNARKGVDWALPKWQTRGVVAVQDGMISLTGRKVAEFFRDIEEIRTKRIEIEGSKT